MADVGMIRTPSRRELLFARSAVVTTACAFGLQAIDLVCVDYKSEEILREECLEGRQMGFTGKVSEMASLATFVLLLFFFSLTRFTETASNPPQPDSSYPGTLLSGSSRSILTFLSFPFPLLILRDLTTLCLASRHREGH